MARRQRDELFALAVEKRIGSRPRARRISRWTSVAKAASKSRFAARRSRHRAAIQACAAARFLDRLVSVAGLFGLTSNGNHGCPGTSSRRNSSCFALEHVAERLTPVTLPPGRLRLATRPI